MTAYSELYTRRRFPKWTNVEFRSGDFLDASRASWAQHAFIPPRVAITQDTHTYGVYGGLTLPSGVIYFAPLGTELYGELYNPVTNTSTPTASRSTTGTLNGAALAVNNKIYHSPDGSSNFYIYDVSGDSWATVASTSGSNQYRGGCLARNGKYYAIPFDSQYVSHIATSTHSTGTIDTGDSNTGKWFGGAYAPNNDCIYCAPYGTTSVLKIDTTNDTVSTIGTVSGSALWAGATLGLDGMIYCAPYSSTTILKIDPYTDTVTEFGSISGSAKYVGIRLSPSGLLYCSPNTATEILEIDTVLGTATALNTVVANRPGMALGLDGNLYGAASSGTNSFLAVQVAHAVPNDFACSIFLNKTI